MPLRDNFTPEQADEIIADVMKNLGLRRADAERLLDRDLPSKRNPLLASQWVANLHNVCEAMREGAAKPIGLFVSVFWIRLYGVLVDLRNRHRPIAEAHRELVEQGRTYSFTAASAEVFHACQAIHDALSEEELIYATFVRHIEAHVFQNSFDYEVERGNPDRNQSASIRTKQMIPALKRHFDVDEAHRVLDAILTKAGGSEARVAVNFAHKVGPHVERLAGAMKALDAEREKDRIASDARRPAVQEAWLRKP